LYQLNINNNSSVDYLIITCFFINLVFSILYIYDLNTDKQIQKETNISISRDLYNSKTQFIELNYEKSDVIDFGNNDSLFNLIKNNKTINVFYTPLFNYPNYVILKETRIDVSKISFNLKLIASILLGFFYTFFLKILENKKTPVLSGIGYNYFSYLLIGIIYIFQIGFTIYGIYKIYSIL